MDTQLAIYCFCGQATLTTSTARRYRCSRCGKEIPVQRGPDYRSGRSQATGSDDSGRGLYYGAGNQRSKCIPFKEGGRVRDAPKNLSPRATGVRGPGDGGTRANKRALICGVSYKNQKYKLRGTLSDAHEMRNFLLRRWDFSTNNIIILTEEAGGLAPTKKNMEEGLKWLVEGCRPGDSLVFYFSGHGINQREIYLGDEIDGLDEALCPVDFSTEGVIRDNDLNAVLVQNLPAGVTLHAVVDACHSGTILDLPWVFNAKLNAWVDNRPPSGASKDTNGGLAISFSACRDDQMAADTSAFTSRGMNGALTMSFIQALSNNNVDLSYHQLLTAMQGAITKSRGSRFRIMLDKFLHRYFVQDPLLSSSLCFEIDKTKFRL